jgi:protein TonB
MPLDSESFKADAEQRMFAPDATVERDRRGLVAALVAACGLHAATLGVLSYQWDLSRSPTPSEREIPVEILVEPPAPKPAQPPAASRPLDERSAHDAPRDATNEQASRDGENEASRSPPATPTPAPPATRPDATKSPESWAKEELQAPSEPADAPLTKTETDLSPEREAQAKQLSKSAEADANPSSAALPAFVGLPFPKWRKGEAVPNFAPLPDFKIASAAEAAPIGGGKAKATYLSVLYGLIMARLQSPAVKLASQARSEGVIVFTLSGTGRLVGRTIEQPSGSRELDAAAYAAVGEGAPYPPPPYGEQIELRFTYGPK